MLHDLSLFPPYHHHPTHKHAINREHTVTVFPGVILQEEPAWGQTETPKITDQKEIKILGDRCKPKSLNRKSTLPMNVFIGEEIKYSISKPAWDWGLVSELKIIQMDLL